MSSPQRIEYWVEFVYGQMLKAGRKMDRDERKYAIYVPDGRAENF